MSEDKRAKYNELMLELYKENQSFLNKAIFGVSTLAIPFLFNALNEDNHSLLVSIILCLSLSGFFTVIMFQIKSLKAARNGCDESMQQNDSAVENGEVLFNKARLLDIWRERFFIGSLGLIVMALFTGVIEKEISMSNNSKTIKMVERSNEKSIQNSFTPPKASVSEQKSFVPPKASVSENKPTSGSESSGGGSEQGQASSSSQGNGNQ